MLWTWSFKREFYLLRRSKIWPEPRGFEKLLPLAACVPCVGCWFTGWKCLTPACWGWIGVLLLDEDVGPSLTGKRIVILPLGGICCPLVPGSGIEILPLGGSFCTWMPGQLIWILPLGGSFCPWMSGSRIGICPLGRSFFLTVWVGDWDSSSGWKLLPLGAGVWIGILALGGSVYPWAPG